MREPKVGGLRNASAVAVEGRGGVASAVAVEGRGGVASAVAVGAAAAWRRWRRDDASDPAMPAVAVGNL